MIRYDSIVVGNGPAALQAAINLKIRGKSFLIFGSADLSKKIRVAQSIDNYLGLPAVTGEELANHFKAHLNSMEIKLQQEQISAIYSMGDYFALASNKDTYEAKSIIIASGVMSSAPFKGEDRLLGRGVGYCATCDAALYKNKTVAIIGYGEEAVHEANFTNELTAKTYYVAMTKHNAVLNDSIEEIKAKIIEISGEKKVSQLILADRTLTLDGVFVLRESLAPNSLISGIDMLDGYIKVDNMMQTNIAGCFAAGDCTGKPHQYMRAAGQGHIAALSAVAYIDQNK